MNQKVPSTDSLIQRLKEISTWVSSVRDLDRLLELIMETASSVLSVKASSLLLLDQRTQKLVFRATTGEMRRQVKAFTVDVGKGIAGHVAKTGEPLLIPDVSKNPLWDSGISKSLHFETRSIACAPLKVDDRTVGVLQIIDKIDDSPLSEADLELLSVFTEAAAQAIANAERFEQVQQENRDLRQELSAKHQLIGESRHFKKVVAEALKVAQSNTTTLILGESGTGKEVLARLIHNSSKRGDGPLVILNCAAMQETLLEAELFGYEKGAFTGALKRKIGKFELAHGGTIFLDEIGEMSGGMQAKLLRVLQEGVFYRVGGNDSISVDVRVLAATNRDIAKDVVEGKFREDLYYRLNIVQIRMPALRERRSDIPLLAEHFLERFKRERGIQKLRLSGQAIEKMKGYEWPGNIRELQNAIERAVVMGEGPEIRPEDLPIFASRPVESGLEVGLTLSEALNRFKKEFIQLNLEHTGGNRSQAARVMGIQRTYLSRLITKYELR
ncbi:MAG: sigma 54-interacting transcriptional regulator [Desulfobacterales bacterium]